MVRIKRPIIFLLILTVLATALAPVAGFASAGEEWEEEWSVAQGFSLNIDSEGFHFPTAIAFVPEPGPNPKDPLYFVTELRGTVKVITNDRTVYKFAEDFFDLTPKEELPSTEGQAGLAGICLAPKQGYVFVTFAYQDSSGVMRNNIVRFQSKPVSFSLAPSSQIDFRNIFLPYESGLAHQIGGCQIRDDLLYVGVGDGNQPTQARKLDAILGKIVRTSLDGKPAPQNPFYKDNGVAEASDYIWAYGLRNPFSIKITGGRVFVADNGQNIDRFVELHEGQDYLWSGHDWSIATNASFVFTPSHSPTQLDFNPKGSSIFPAHYEDHFFVGTAGVVKEAGPAPRGKTKGILSFKFDFERNKLLTVPEFILTYQGDGYQAMVGLAFGSDGLYFAPLYPNVEGRSAIYRLSYEPENAHPYTLEQSRNPLAIMTNYGCFGCHSLNNRGGSEGPSLDREAMVERIHSRINSDEYKKLTAKLDRMEAEPYRSFRNARAEVASTQDLEQIRIWLRYHLLQPKFDNPVAKMPYFGFSEEEANTLAGYLLGEKATTDRSLKDRIAAYLPYPLRYRYLLYSFAGGVFLTLLTLPLLKYLKTFKEENRGSTTSGIYRDEAKERLSR